MDSKAVLELAINTGQLMLVNGCGTSRIEGVIKSILSTKNFIKNEVFVTTSGIVVTIESQSTGVLTMVKQVQKKSMHMERITMIEEIIDSFRNGRITADEALSRLDTINTNTGYRFLITTLAFGGAATFRTLMFNGNYWDAFTSFFVGICLGIFVQTLNSKGVITFLVNIFGGFIVGFSTVLFMRYGFGTSLDKIIIGSLIAIAPGVPFLHAVNDILKGEHISGGIRALEALITGVAIATGIAFSVKLWLFLTKGGVL